MGYFRVRRGCKGGVYYVTFNQWVKKIKLKLSLPVLPVELQKMKDTVRVNIGTFQRVQKFYDSSFILEIYFNEKLSGFLC